MRTLVSRPRTFQNRITCVTGCAEEKNKCIFSLAEKGKPNSRAEETHFCLQISKEKEELEKWFSRRRLGLWSKFNKFVSAKNQLKIILPFLSRTNLVNVYCPLGTWDDESSIGFTRSPLLFSLPTSKSPKLFCQNQVLKKWGAHVTTGPNSRGLKGIYTCKKGPPPLPPPRERRQQEDFQSFFPPLLPWVSREKMVPK